MVRRARLSKEPKVIMARRKRIPTIPRATDQLALDEQTIEDPEVEQALVVRQEAKDDRAAAGAVFKAADETAKTAIERLELPTGGVVRVGRFRIERKEVAARNVAFETEASTRLQIALVEG